MRKFAAIALAASALLITKAGAAQGPELDVAKKVTKEQAPPAAVMAPLCVGTAFNAVLTDDLDTRKARPGDTVTAEIAEVGEDAPVRRCSCSSIRRC